MQFLNLCACCKKFSSNSQNMSCAWEHPWASAPYLFTKMPPSGMPQKQNIKLFILYLSEEFATALILHDHTLQQIFNTHCLKCNIQTQRY